MLFLLLEATPYWLYHSPQTLPCFLQAPNSLQFWKTALLALEEQTIGLKLAGLGSVSTLCLTACAVLGVFHSVWEGRCPHL